MQNAALPYYAVIFTCQRVDVHDSSYEQMAERMFELVEKQDGYIGHEHVHNSDGLGITVSYWRDKKSIRKWRDHTEHWIARELGRGKWYDWYNIKVCKVERSYGSHSPEQHAPQTDASTPPIDRLPDDSARCPFSQ